MEYVREMPKIPSFTQDGLNGFSFDINNKNVSIDFIETYKGHERYCINKESSHIYYVLDGNGIFKIDDKLFEVEKGNVIEIPKNIEFVYAGKMKLILITSPAFQSDNIIYGKNNDLYKS